jgi:hypothetical protein
MRLIRITLVSAAIAAGAVVTAPTAHAVPGHTSCRDLGALTVSEAQDQTLAPELRSIPPGSVDDLIALVQTGGELDGETIPRFCEPK